MSSITSRGIRRRRILYTFKANPKARSETLRANSYWILTLLPIVFTSNFRSTVLWGSRYWVTYPPKNRWNPSSRWSVGGRACSHSFNHYFLRLMGLICINFFPVVVQREQCSSCIMVISPFNNTCLRTSTVGCLMSPVECLRSAFSEVIGIVLKPSDFFLVL